jgi:GH15 family glucan-1,4-alpha-glucosidase
MNGSPYRPIGAYAAIGDSRTLALVDDEGQIAWMCLPELDSPSVFATILDPGRGGHFTLQPAVPFSAERRYLQRTNVLQTTFHAAGGTVRVTDALTIDDSQAAPWRELVRRIDGLTGSVPMRWWWEPRFQYGAEPAALTRHGDLLIAAHDGLMLGLRSWGAGDPALDASAAHGDFTATEGSSSMLALTTSTGHQPLPRPDRDAVQRRLDETTRVWRSWVARHSYDGPWTDAVERSLLAIRLLADGRTGAIAAAGTTSLPEVIGGSRNYDYRFGWVRDLSFTLDALLAVGMDQLTHTSISWILAATLHTHPRIDPVYALDGTVVRDQRSLPLAGYRATGPVHVGNAAGAQLQLGGFGDLMETICLYLDRGHVLGAETGARLSDVASLLTAIWRRPDSGLWELGEHAHYGTSKLGVWVALDRAVTMAERGHLPSRHLVRWQKARDEVAGFIERELVSPATGSYRFKAGADALDCGMLLAARRRFGDPSGTRMTATIAAIRSELSAGGPLLYRYSGMQDQENAFLACSFWLAEALALGGRVDEAAAIMDEMTGLANDVGLYSEEIEPGTKALRGNLPQALTHLALISAADAIARRRAQPAHTDTTRAARSGRAVAGPLGPSRSAI